MIFPWKRGIVASTFRVLLETLEELHQRSTCCCETAMLRRQDFSGGNRDLLFILFD